MFRDKADHTNLYEVLMWILVGPIVFGGVVAVLATGLAGFGSNAAMWAQLAATIVLVGIAVTVPWTVHRMQALERRRIARARARTVAMRALPTFREHRFRLSHIAYFKYVTDIQPAEGYARVFHSEEHADAYENRPTGGVLFSEGAAPVPLPARAHVGELTEKSVVPEELSSLLPDLELLDSAAFAAQAALQAASELPGLYKHVFAAGLSQQHVSVDQVRTRFALASAHATRTLDHFREAVKAMKELMASP